MSNAVRRATRGGAEAVGWLVLVKLGLVAGAALAGSVQALVQ